MAGQIERAKVFLRVAELSSFAEAARSLGMARSVVTRQVAELEQALGVQLLVRTTRRVSLTQAGESYLSRIRPLIDEFDRIDRLMGEEQGLLSGELRLSAPVSFGQRFLPGALTEFQRLYPDVVIRVDLTDRFIDILAEGYDMALRISGPPRDVSTIWRKIGQVPRAIVASPAYLAGAPAPTDPRDLRDHRILCYSHFAGGTSWQLSRRDDERVIQMPPGALESNNGDLLVDMAVAGGGVTMMPRFLVGAHLQAGRLVAILPEWSPPPIWLTAFYPPYSTLPAKVRAFTEFVEKALARAPEALG